jgi:hypothetical protein
MSNYDRVFAALERAANMFGYAAGHLNTAAEALDECGSKHAELIREHAKSARAAADQAIIDAFMDVNGTCSRRLRAMKDGYKNWYDAGDEGFVGEPWEASG